MSAANSKPQGPEDVSPSLLWAMYTKGPVPHEIVDLPVSDQFVLRSALPHMAMVPLTAEEAMYCQAEADGYAKDLLKKNPPKGGEPHKAYDNIYEQECLIRVLWRACRDMDDPTLVRKVFQSPAAMRMRLTLDQLSVMGLNYTRVERLLSPIRSIMTVEEMDVFVDRLVEGGRQAPLDWISSELLRDLVWRLASQRSASRLPSGSPGTAPDESTSSAATPAAPEETAPALASTELPVSDAPKEPPPRLV